MKLLYGTGNPAKLDAMKKRLAILGIECIGLREIDRAVPEVIEDGSTPLENAEKKAKAYYEAFHMPVFSCDSGLYIDGIPKTEQPGVHVRTINGKYLTDDEMLEYYINMVVKYGDLVARYRNAICLYTDDGRKYSAMDKDMESGPFLITQTAHRIRKKGFPLDSISLDIKTGKHFYDLTEEELDQVAVEDGFLRFFKNLNFLKNRT